MTQSEKELTDFLEFKEKEKIIMSLHPQGDNTIIEKEAVNLCEVKIDDKLYRFGGISEEVYDKLVIKYDSRERDKMDDSLLHYEFVIY